MNGDFRGLALAGTAALELVLPILLGAWVDRSYQTEPWGVVAGAVIGFTVTITHLFLMSQRSGRGGSPPSTGQNP